jgi:hypothetical protein
MQTDVSLLHSTVSDSIGEFCQTAAKRKENKSFVRRFKHVSKNYCLFLLTGECASLKVWKTRFRQKSHTFVDHYAVIQLREEVNILVEYKVHHRHHKMPPSDRSLNHFISKVI